MIVACLLYNIYIHMLNEACIFAKIMLEGIIRMNKNLIIRKIAFVSRFFCKEIEQAMR